MVRITHSEIEIDTPADRVWTELTNFSLYPSWNTYIQSIVGEVKEGNTAFLTEQAPGEKAVMIKVTFSKVVANSELRWKAGLKLPGVLEGERIFQLVKVSDKKTRFVHDDQLSGALSDMAKIGDIMAKHLEGMKTMNTILKQRCEKGYSTTTATTTASTPTTDSSTSSSSSSSSTATAATATTTSTSTTTTASTSTPTPPATTTDSSPSSQPAPTETENDSSSSLTFEQMRDAIVPLIKDPVSGFEVKDRVYRLKTYKQCFVGSEAVDWMMKNLRCASRADAVIIGRFLHSANVFRHVADEHTFEDGFFFYRFM